MLKGLLNWLRASTKIKRWISLIVIGIALACVGICKLLTAKTMSIAEIVLVAVLFIIGFVSIIMGIVFIQKRTLELLIEETDERDKKVQGDVNSLIFNKKVYNDGPKVVVIGGGSGLNTVLLGLKNYTKNITAIVTVSDYGDARSSSSKLLNTMPLEDVKGSVVALSDNEIIMDHLLNHKFSNRALKSLTFGDIYVTAMQELYGDFAKSIEETNKVLNIQGKVLPVTTEEIKICAELDDGTVIENKHEIPEKVNDRTGRINRIFISPSNCRVAPDVIEAINEADAIIIGPGSLYTNVIPNLLVKGIAKAIRESNGFKIYVSNIMTESGQTDNYTLSEHIKAIMDHVGKGIVDYCIYDTGEIVPEAVRKSNLRGQDIVEQDVGEVKALGVKLVQRNLSKVYDKEYIKHDPDILAATIIELICDDLKFRDQQNDAQYLMLNSKLKNKTKQIKNSKKQQQKKLAKENNKKKNKNKKRKSKFFNKYKERIQSIRESELKIKEKEKKINKALEKERKMREYKEKFEQGIKTKTKATGTKVSPEKESSRNKKSNM